MLTAVLPWELWALGAVPEGTTSTLHCPEAMSTAPTNTKPGQSGTGAMELPSSPQH